MGRTLPTFNIYLEHEMDAWRPFRRALRKEDQESFDRLFAMAKRHMAEAAYMARPVPFDTLVMAILLELQKEIEEMRNGECGMRNENCPTLNVKCSMLNDQCPMRPTEEACNE